MDQKVSSPEESSRIVADKAHCFSQSECRYGNFIIIGNNCLVSVQSSWNTNWNLHFGVLI